MTDRRELLVNALIERSWLLRAILCATSGIACGLAAPPARLAGLVWIAWIPTFYVLMRTRPGWRQAALLGWISGLGIGCIGFSWMGRMLVAFGGFPPLLGLVGMFVYAAWMAIPYAAFGIAIAASAERRLPNLVVALVVFIAATHAWPLVFPYTPLIGLTQSPPFIQLAELGGVALVEAHVLTAAWAAACALASTRRATRARFAVLALGIPLVSYLSGQLRIDQIQASALDAPRVRVGLIQPNTPPLFRDSAESMERLWSASESAEREGAEWLVWPEAGPYPFALARPVRSEPQSRDARILARHRVPTLVGVVTFPARDPAPYNTLIHVAADGRVTESYDKVRLVAFGERIPLVDPEWLKALVPIVSQLNAGEGAKSFRLALQGKRELRVGPLICLEDILADFVHETAQVPGGVEVFVNATIDAWYGTEKEPWEHLALAQFRSVEHRIPLVRSVSTGVTSVVDATGELVALRPPRAATPGGEPSHEAEYLVHELALTRNTESHPTPFSRFGFLLVPSCQLLAVIWVLNRGVRRWRGWRTRDPADHSEGASLQI